MFCGWWAMWSWSSVSVWFLVSCHIALGDSRASVFFGCVRCMFCVLLVCVVCTSAHCVLVVRRWRHVLLCCCGCRPRPR